MADNKEAPVYEKQELIKSAASIFGTQPEIMAGALYNAGDTLTIEQAKNKLVAFLKRPVIRG